VHVGPGEGGNCGKGKEAMVDPGSCIGAAADGVERGVGEGGAGGGVWGEVGGEGDAQGQRLAWQVLVACGDGEGDLLSWLCLQVALTPQPSPLNPHPYKLRGSKVQRQAPLNP
jgi:hypothetical protein